MTTKGSMEEKFKTRAGYAQEMVKNIRILALNGKNNFRKFLFDPLYEAGWYNDTSRQSTATLIEKMKEQPYDSALVHTIAPQCKRLVCFSMSEGLSPLGNSSIFFLEKIQWDQQVALSNESIEFTGIIMPPLNEFMKLNNESNEKLFTEAVASAEKDEILTAFEPVKLSSGSVKVQLDSEIKRLYNNIQIASRYQNIPKCMKLLSTYIIQYSDNEEYARGDVEKLVDAMTKRAPGFDTDLRNTMAIDLYYRIRKSVHDGDISTTIQAIRKYGYIFEGDSSAKHFYDIDRFERILYKIITEKGLWKDLKKEARGQ